MPKNLGDLSLALGKIECKCGKLEYFFFSNWNILQYVSSKALKILQGFFQLHTVKMQ